MNTLGQHFDDLLKNIQPPQARLQAAKEIPGDLREFLKSQSEFATTSPHSRLVGSYARDNSAGDVKDVDILAYYSGTVKEEPAAVLSKLKKALSNFPGYLHDHGEAEVSSSRRSVRVYFEDKDFYLDVVPCIASGEPDEVVRVPDREQRSGSAPTLTVTLNSSLSSMKSMAIRSDPSSG